MLKLTHAVHMLILSPRYNFYFECVIVYDSQTNMEAVL